MFDYMRIFDAGYHLDSATAFFADCNIDIEISLEALCLYALRVPANTPWNRIKLALGFGTSAASRAIKSR